MEQSIIWWGERWWKIDWKVHSARVERCHSLRGHRVFELSHFHSPLFRHCRRHLILSCQGSLNIFPFDDPLCSFALESSKLSERLFCAIRSREIYWHWQILQSPLKSASLLVSVSYEQSAISYVWKNDEDTLRKSPSLTTLNAYLVQNQTDVCEIKGSWRGLYTMSAPMRWSTDSKADATPSRP